MWTKCERQPRTKLSSLFSLLRTGPGGPRDPHLWPPAPRAVNACVTAHSQPTAYPPHASPERGAGWRAGRSPDAPDRAPSSSPLFGICTRRALRTRARLSQGRAPQCPEPMGVSLPALRDRASPLANRPKATFPNSYTNNKLDVFQFMKRMFLPLNIQIHIFENDI